MLPRVQGPGSESPGPLKKADRTLCTITVALGRAWGTCDSENLPDHPASYVSLGLEGDGSTHDNPPHLPPTKQTYEQRQGIVL